jgi:predicted transcriptional regulator
MDELKQKESVETSKDSNNSKIEAIINKENIPSKQLNELFLDKNIKNKNNDSLLDRQQHQQYSLNLPLKKRRLNND